MSYHLKKKFRALLWRDVSWKVEYPSIIRESELVFLLKDKFPFHLGSGAQGDVYLAYHLPSLSYVAVKYFRSATESLMEVFREAACLCLAGKSGLSPKLLGLIPNNSLSDHERYGIVMEFIGDKTTHEAFSLKGVIKDCKVFPDGDFIGLFESFLISVLNMHRSGLILADLKVDNCLLDRSKGEWKHIDMGMTVPKGHQVNYRETYQIAAENAHSFLRTYRQVAPETVFYNYMDEKSDVYRIGRIMNYVSRIRPELEKHLAPLAKTCLMKATLRPTVSSLIEKIHAIK